MKLFDLPGYNCVSPETQVKSTGARIGCGRVKKIQSDRIDTVVTMQTVG